MFTLPSLPAWEGAHPIIVHFPIALLSFAPVFLLIAIFSRSQRLAWMTSFLITTALGTLGAWLATWNGDATEHALELSPEIRRLVHDHEEAAELARNIFIGVAILAGAITLGTWKSAKFRANGAPVLVFLLFVHGAGTLALINAGHLGGLLVHQHGLRAPMGAPTTAAVGVVPAAPETAVTSGDD